MWLKIQDQRGAPSKRYFLFQFMYGMHTMRIFIMQAHLPPTWMLLRWMDCTRFLKLYEYWRFTGPKGTSIYESIKLLITAMPQSTTIVLIQPLTLTWQQVSFQPISSEPHGHHTSSDDPCGVGRLPCLSGFLKCALLPCPQTVQKADSPDVGVLEVNNKN